jgi:anti-sigma regulatory factor (Ser/Thr protein kinase)
MVRDPVCEEFGSAPTDVARARRFARAVADQWGLDVPDLELVVGELASNAVLHAGSGYTVRLCRDGAGLVVEVADGNPRQPRVNGGDASTGALSGRGLAIVGRVSACWGVRADGPGKVVWATLPVLAAPSPSVNGS